MATQLEHLAGRLDNLRSRPGALPHKEALERTAAHLRTAAARASTLLLHPGAAQAGLANMQKHVQDLDRSGNGLKMRLVSAADHMAGMLFKLTEQFPHMVSPWGLELARPGASQRVTSVSRTQARPLGVTAPALTRAPCSPAPDLPPTRQVSTALLGAVAAAAVEYRVAAAQYEATSAGCTHFPGGRGRQGASVSGGCRPGCASAQLAAPTLLLRLLAPTRRCPAAPPTNHHPQARCQPTHPCQAAWGRCWWSWTAGWTATCVAAAAAPAAAAARAVAVAAAAAAAASPTRRRQSGTECWPCWSAAATAPVPSACGAC